MSHGVKLFPLIGELETGSKLLPIDEKDLRLERLLLLWNESLAKNYEIPP